jgi:aromatic-L-amino-acid decarboxylase
MTPDEFRQAGHALVEWIAAYQERVETLPVLSRVQPGEVRAALPPHPPAQGEPFGAMLADVEQVILPGVTHWQSPHFHAYFPANVSGPAILGELLSAGLGVQGMLWVTGPACTELETHVLDWMAEMLDLPGQFRSTGTGGGVIEDSASSAALCALLAARERATGLRSNEQGAGGRLTVYATAHTHSSIEKGVKVAGVTATVGTTSSNAMDPLPEIGRICHAHGVWLHVDAAMAGTAAICPEFRHLQAGVELADSYCFNPHKWMFTNFDCTCFFVADRAALINALSVLPEYLRNQASQSGAVIDYRDWQVPLGRRFRALKLWFVIRHYGVEGLRHHVREHVRLAQQFKCWVEADPRFEIAAPAPLNLVCFRLRAGDAANEALLADLNATGSAYLTHTKLDGKFTLRMVIGQTHTEERHVALAWELIRELAGKYAPA